MWWRPADGDWGELLFMSRMEGLVKDAELLVYKDAQLRSQDNTSILGLAPRNSRAVAAGPAFTASDGITYVPIVGLCDIFQQPIMFKVDHGSASQIDPKLIANSLNPNVDPLVFTIDFIVFIDNDGLVKVSPSKCINKTIV